MTPRHVIGLVALAALLIIVYALYAHFGTAPNWYRT